MSGDEAYANVGQHVAALKIRLAMVECERDAAEAARDLLAQAIWDARTTLGFDADGDTRHHSTDWALIARSHVSEAKEARRDHDEALDEGIAAEAAVARVRALADEWAFEQGDLGNDTFPIRAAATAIRAALDPEAGR